MIYQGLGKALRVRGVAVIRALKSMASKFGLHSGRGDNWDRY